MPGQGEYGAAPRCERVGHQSLTLAPQASWVTAAHMHDTGERKNAKIIEASCIEANNM